MKRPKIKTSLVILFSMMGLLSTGFALFTVDRMSAINKQTSDIAGNWMPSLALGKDADKSLTFSLGR